MYGDLVTTTEIDYYFLMNIEAGESSPFVSGYVSLIGRPNSGKSTLLNQVLGQAVSVTHAKPQTTRHRIMGIQTTEEAQMIFLDTPGMHKPRNQLGHFMMDQVAGAMEECDVLLWLSDITRPPGAAEQSFLSRLEALQERRKLPHVVLGFNKIDELAGREDQLADLMDAYWNMARRHMGSDVAAAWTGSPLCAESGFGVPELIRLVQLKLPAGPKYYPEDQVTDQSLRSMAAELIRKQALQCLDEEIPHGIAVEVLEYTERSPEMTYVSAVIYVERESHKPIVLGRQGRVIRRLGAQARAEMEELVETQVYLDLWVKVRQNWRKRPGMLRMMGYAQE